MLLSCGSSKNVIHHPTPEIQTVYIEKETGNKVSDHDMLLLTMLKNGCKNFNTSDLTLSIENFSTKPQSEDMAKVHYRRMSIEFNEVVEWIKKRLHSIC